MKDISVATYIEKYVEDEYAMNVFYYSVKKSFVQNDYSLYGFSYFFIDGRFLGESLRVIIKRNLRTPMHALAFLLSLRLLIINPKYKCLCEGENLIFASKPMDSFEWVGYITCIMENWDDEEVKMLYQMLENYYIDELITEDDKELFSKNIIEPDFKNEKKYYQYLASKTHGVSDTIIGDNAFLEADFEEYTIPEDIVYVGNTAFAYCDKLESLTFEGKVMFGTFPIIECINLKRILVPKELKDYYVDALPFYKDIISDSEHTNHIDIVSEDSVENEHREPIDTTILKDVFNKKATSYKYFWMMAIISIAKETNTLSISYDEITIRMASIAWPIIFEDEISLGGSDMMRKYLEEIVRNTTLIKQASSNVVENYLTQHYTSQKIDKILSPLMKNVPYRFLSPWIKYTTDDDVARESQKMSFNGMYAIYPEYIVLDKEWWEYIDSKYIEICDFIIRSFISYAKKYNSDMKLLKLMTTGWSQIRKPMP